MSEFEDIRIVGMDDESSSKRDPHLALFDIVLDLSGGAPPEWAQYFNARWDQHFYMMKREASVSGSRLTICCVPDELEKSHLPELKKVIDETNQKYKQYLESKRAAQQHADQIEQEKRDKLRDLKNNLKFD